MINKLTNTKILLGAIPICLAISGLIFLLYLLVRCWYVDKKMKYLIDLVYIYQIYCIDNDLPMDVSYDDIKEIDDVVFDTFNWDYSTYIKKESYEKLLDFVENDFNIVE